MKNGLDGHERTFVRHVPLLASPTPRTRGAIRTWRGTPSLRVAGFEDDEGENASGSSSLPVFQSFPAKPEKGETLGSKASELIRELRRT
jgi:hypothetical protein